MRDDFAVGLALERSPVGDQLVAERPEVLDDAVMHKRDRARDMGVGVADGRRTMRRPARVGDADRAAERVLVQLAGEVVELALCTAPVELASIDRADAGRIITAIL